MLPEGRRAQEFWTRDVYKIKAVQQAPYPSHAPKQSTAVVPPLFGPPTTPAIPPASTDGSRPDARCLVADSTGLSSASFSEPEAALAQEEDSLGYGLVLSEAASMEVPTQQLGQV